MRAAFLLAMLLLGSPALADGQAFPMLASTTLVAGSWPDGFTPFCREHPDQCEPVKEIPSPMNYLQWESRLDDTNRQVNSSIEYRLDVGDHFDDSPKHGDCDDYALTKRNILLSLGFERSNLLFAFVMLHGMNEKHTVLVVRTNYGLKVMDNRFDEVYDFGQMMVDWAWLQSPRFPRVWLRAD